MRDRQLVEIDGLRTFAVVFDGGDEAHAGLTNLARDRAISGASLSAIGGFSEATLAYFDAGASEYVDIPVDDQVEVLSLIGDIAMAEGEPQVHAHVVVGRRDGSTLGGHLKRAVVFPTLEVIVTETPTHLRKSVDPGTGLTLIDLDGAAP